MVHSPAMPSPLPARLAARGAGGRAAARRRGHVRALLLVAGALVAAALLLLARGAGAQASTQASTEASTQASARDTAASVAIPTAATARARSAGKGGAPARTAAARRADSSTVTIVREVFSYASAGRRDPFKSLLTTSDLRPLLSELRLVGIAVDPTGRNSVAVLRDLTTKAQHRVRVGQLLGRMRVSQIRPRAVVFTVEELGFSRQETLALTDSSVARTK